MMYSEFLDRVIIITGTHVNEEMYHRFIEPVYNNCNDSKDEFCRKFAKAYYIHYSGVMKNLTNNLPAPTPETETAFEIIRSNCEQHFLRSFRSMPEQYGIYRLHGERKEVV